MNCLICCHPTFVLLSLRHTVTLGCCDFVAVASLWCLNECYNAFHPYDVYHALPQKLSDTAISSRPLAVDIPDAAAVLVPAALLSFNDAPWMVIPADVRFVHPKLSNAVAERVRARAHVAAVMDFYMPFLVLRLIPFTLD